MLCRVLANILCFHVSWLLLANNEGMDSRVYWRGILGVRDGSIPSFPASTSKVVKLLPNKQSYPCPEKPACTTTRTPRKPFFQTAKPQDLEDVFEERYAGTILEHC